MGLHAPALEVGEISLGSHTTDVNAMPGLAQIVKDQEDVVDDARVARDASIATIKDLTVRMPRKLEGELGPKDPYHADIRTVRLTEIDDPKSATVRGQRMVSLLKKYNARQAAAVPAKPPLTVGGQGIAVLEAALAALLLSTQEVEDEISDLKDKRDDRDALTDKVDTNNKRLYVAMQGEFATGSAARAALDQIDTGHSGGGGEPPTVPATPENLALTPGAAASGLLTADWDAVPGATSYKLRSGAPGPEQTLLGTFTEPHAELSLASGVEQTLTVSALNDAGESPQSDPVTGTPG